MVFQDRSYAVGRQWGLPRIRSSALNRHYFGEECEMPFGLKTSRLVRRSLLSFVAVKSRSECWLESTVET